MDKFTKEEIAWLKKSSPKIGKIEDEIKDRFAQYIAIGLSSDEAESRSKSDFANYKILRWE